MATRLILLFNHELTADQDAEARAVFGISSVLTPPPELRRLWAEVPPQAAALGEFLRPFRDWLQETAHPGDILLVQGDFGATYQMVLHAFALGLRPVYGTSHRMATERKLPDGTIELVHQFRHCRFRTYGE